MQSGTTARTGARGLPRDLMPNDWKLQLDVLWGESLAGTESRDFPASCSSSSTEVIDLTADSRTDLSAPVASNHRRHDDRYTYAPSTID